MVRIQNPRCFRFGMRTLLLLPVLVGGVWWWGTWPERTAGRFVKLIAEGDVQAARSMLASTVPKVTRDDSDSRNNELDMWGVAQEGGEQFDQPGFHPRSLVDRLFGRGTFSVSADRGKVRLYYGSFIARWGAIRPLSDLESSTLVAIYSFRNVDVARALAKMKAEFTPDLPMRIVADEESNGLILVASQQAHDEFSKLVRRIDQESMDAAAW